MVYQEIKQPKEEKHKEQCNPLLEAATIQAVARTGFQRAPLCAACETHRAASEREQLLLSKASRCDLNTAIHLMA